MGAIWAHWVNLYTRQSVSSAQYAWRFTDGKIDHTLFHFHLEFVFVAGHLNYNTLQHKTFVKGKILEPMTKIVIHNKHQIFDKLHVINYYNSYHFLPTHIQTGHKFHIFTGRIDVRQACLSACTYLKFSYYFYIQRAKFL